MQAVTKCQNPCDGRYLFLEIFSVPLVSTACYNHYWGCQGKCNLEVLLRSRIVLRLRHLFILSHLVCKAIWICNLSFAPSLRCIKDTFHHCPVFSIPFDKYWLTPCIPDDAQTNMVLLVLPPVFLSTASVIPFLSSFQFQERVCFAG